MMKEKKEIIGQVLVMMRRREQAAAVRYDIDGPPVIVPNNEIWNCRGNG